MYREGQCFGDHLIDWGYPQGEYHGGPACARPFFSEYLKKTLAKPLTFADPNRDFHVSQDFPLHC